MSSEQPGGPGDGGGGGDVPLPRDARGRLSVLIEMHAPPGGSPSLAIAEANAVDVPGFEVDNDFEVVPLASAEAGAAPGGGGETYIVRGTVGDDGDIERLRARPEVVKVWTDTPIAPFPLGVANPRVAEVRAPDAARCPISPCDCEQAVPKGTIADVAEFLAVTDLWAAGIKGSGIVVGVVDGGITALGRPVKDGETRRRIPRVIGGWPTESWGTEARQWSEHGNMCATDVLGMAPEASLLDLRISGAGAADGTVSRALQAFQWAINRHRADGTPQVLTNSWGIYQEAWDPVYARSSDHPFVRKVVEAIDEGILVLFAAGNCGATCPLAACGGDVGPGRSIWGANGHPRVMSVGAVNSAGEYVGYSSQGPAALGPGKPDFCGITHFTGYFASDGGTSAATPVAAGVAALLKQGAPKATQASTKESLKATARNIGPPGFDRHSGAGIIDARRALEHLRRRHRTDRGRQFGQGMQWTSLSPAERLARLEGAVDVFARYLARHPF